MTEGRRANTTGVRITGKGEGGIPPTEKELNATGWKGEKGNSAVKQGRFI